MPQVEDILDLDPSVYDQFISNLPTREMIESPNYRPGGDDYMLTVLNIGQKTYGRLLGSWGGPLNEIAAFEQYAANVPLVSHLKLAEAWKTGDVAAVADQALENIDLALSQLSVYEEFPLIGIFITLGRNIIETINWGVTTATDAQNQVEAARMSYSKQNDSTSVETVFSVLSSSHDFTDIFMPFTIPPPIDPGDPRESGLEHLGIDPNSDGVATGVMIRMMGTELPGAQGFHPGTSQIVRAWQYKTGDASQRSKRKGWTYTKGYNRAEDGKVTRFDQFHPALQQCSLLLWQRLLRNSPELFALDAAKMRLGWSRYFGAMEMYMTLSPDDKGSYNTPEFVRPMTMGVLRFLLRPDQWGCTGNFVRDGISMGWQFNGVMVPLTYYTDPQSWTEGISVTPAARNWRYGEKVPRLTAKGVTEFLIDTQLVSRQYNALDSLTCAYVAQDAPALVGNPGLFEKWQTRRAQLLQHPGRGQIDLELVPQSQWRNQLVQSLAPDRLPTGHQFTPFGGATISNVPPEPVTPAFPGVPARQTTGGRGGSGAPLLAAAAVALLLLGRK